LQGNTVLTGKRPVRFAAKQKPHRPGIAPALGLRAGSDVFYGTADHKQEQTMNPLLSVITQYFRRSYLDRGSIRMGPRQALRPPAVGKLAAATAAQP
jgi:hypothetical protein